MRRGLFHHCLAALWLLCSAIGNSMAANSFLVHVPRVRRQGGNALPPEDAEPHVTSFSVESWIQLRYAKTHVESVVTNPSRTAAQAVQFEMLLPSEAFISNFSLVLSDGGPEYVAEVKAAAEATRLYQAALAGGQGAALVEQDTRNARLFRVAVNLEPGTGGVRFRLTYEELLQRARGRYEHVIYAGSPGQVVDNYTIVVHIDESLPLLSLTVEEPQVNHNQLGDEDDNADSGSRDPKKAATTAEIRRAIGGDASRAEVRFQPTRKAQEAVGGLEGLTGELIVTYDVDRKEERNEIQVVDGYFVHFFTPDQLPVLPKHVTFVLDVSGSMEGEKLQQLKDAMFTILNDMSDKDFLTLITFSSTANSWTSERGSITGVDLKSSPMAATAENRQRAIAHILELKATGGTNINEALQKAVQLAGSVAASGALPPDMQSLVVFLTDGQPTEGETDGATIRQNLRVSNRVSDKSIPIYCIAFGRDADFGLVKAIAEEAAGAFARQVYEGSDAALQLEDFYALIASPLLAQLKFVYVGDGALEVQNQSLTATSVSNLFQGGEFVVAGKMVQPAGTKGTSRDRLKVMVAGRGSAAKVFSDQLLICLPPVEQDDTDHGVFTDDCEHPPVLQPRSEAQTFLKRLHAFLNIRQLLKTSSEANREKARLLALENNFVTEVTSLLVRRPDGGQEVASATNIRLSNRFPNAWPKSKSVASPVDYSDEELNDNYAEDEEIDYAVDEYDFRIASTPRASFDDDEVEVEASYGRCGVVGESSQLTLYTATYYRAENLTLTDSVADLSGGAGGRAVSARLTGPCCWVLYAELNYAGESVRLEPGKEYKSVTSLGRLLQKVKSAEKKDCREK